MGPYRREGAPHGRQLQLFGGHVECEFSNEPPHFGNCVHCDREHFVRQARMNLLTYWTDDGRLPVNGRPLPPLLDGRVS